MKAVTAFDTPPPPGTIGQPSSRRGSGGAVKAVARWGSTDVTVMRIRDVTINDVAAGRNWRLRDAAASSMTDWEIEPCSAFRSGDNVVYSGLAVLGTDEVRPLLLVREFDTYEWWGDTCEYVGGAWRELGQADPGIAEAYVADPLSDDPSFMGEYSHEKQRAGFARWRERLRVD